MAIALVIAWAFAPVVAAQPAPVAGVAAVSLAAGGDASGRMQPDRSNPPGAEEWMLALGAARSVEVFHSRGGVRYALQTVSWARDVTGDHGRGWLRGRLAWGVEVTPVLYQSAPSSVYGFGVTPFVARWNFAPRRGWSAFTEVAGGFLGSSDPIPDGLARFNFMAHWGAGVRLPISRDRGVIVGYRFQHISNGDRLPANPGVNSHVVMAGLALADWP